MTNTPKTDALKLFCHSLMESRFSQKENNVILNPIDYRQILDELGYRLSSKILTVYGYDIIINPYCPKDTIYSERKPQLA
jgi:hypothetical protein